jgi:mannose-6-phosphate isomerase
VGEPIGPFTLEPVLLEKIWGGRRLTAMLGLPPSTAAIGEAWLCADMSRTSATGAGGGEIVSVISGGWLAGQRLDVALRAHSREILGRAASSFPLLVKLLDSTRPLSVQVHPSRSYAAAHPESALKDEAWIVLHAEPGSTVVTGVRGLRGEAELLRAARNGTLVQHLDTVPARVGDVIDVPSGIVHALGAGITVLEVQTPSDTTFRLYDWAKELGDSGRPLQMEEAALAADLRRSAIARTPAAAAGVERLLELESFGLSQLGAGEHKLADLARVGEQGRPGCVLVFASVGGASVSAGAVRFAPVANRVTVVPAAIVMDARVTVPAGQSVTIIATN